MKCHGHCPVIGFCKKWAKGRFALLSGESHQDSFLPTTDLTKLREGNNFANTLTSRAILGLVTTQTAVKRNRALKLTYKNGSQGNKVGRIRFMW